MKQFLSVALFALPFLVAACGGVPGDPGSSTGPSNDPTGQQTAAVKACPYMIPYCPSDCRLVGRCPAQCVCDNGQSTLCGTQHCGANEYCCASTTAGYECLPTGYMCPL